MTPQHAGTVDPDSVIAALEAAGLRQKGGTGSALAGRWQAVRRAVAETPRRGGLVVCNALDGDARAQIARFALQRDPRAVVEGLLIAAHAVGAGSCVVCVSAEHENEAAALERSAADIATEAPAPSVRVQVMAGSLVEAEETALVRALEGRQALPYLLPAGDVTGVNGVPTLVESAETFAAVAALFGGAGGAEAMQTKMIAVFGDGVEPATVQLPLGTTIAGALEQASGRGVAELNVKAVQFGGPASPFLAGAALVTPIDEEGLEQAGAALGWGGLEVFATGRCAVEMARDVTARLHEESCGTCVFCREGSRQIVDILNDVVAGSATGEQMELLRELGEAMKTGSICSLGRGAALPALSALELFAADFKAHLETKRCPEAGR